MVDCVLQRRWTIEMTAERFQVDAKTVRKWRDRFIAEGAAVCWIAVRDRTDRRTAQQLNAEMKCCGYVASIVGVPITSRTRPAWPRRRCKTS